MGVMARPWHNFHMQHWFGAALLALAGCSDAPIEAPKPVLVVGIDGLDPGLLGPLIEAGRVPHFARLAEEGTLGRLATMVPTWSPVIWTTIATGQPLAVHGVDNFLDSSTATADSAGLPFTSNARRVPAVWDLASNAGRTVDCTGWWVTWPAERVNGRLVASYAAQAQAQVIWKPTLWDDLEEQTWPPELAKEIKPFLVLAEGIEQALEPMRAAFPIPAELDDHVKRLITDLVWVYVADLSVTQVAGHLLESGQADLSLAYLAMPDVAGHRFWKYMRPSDVRFEIAPLDIEHFENYIELSYIAADRMLGELMERMAPDTTLIVLSDHGMHVDPVNVNLPTALNSGAHEDAPDGIFGILGPLAARRGNQLKSAQVLGSVDEVAALIMQMQQLPIPREWPAASRPQLRLEGVLDTEWRIAHPNVVGDGMLNFRAATPSRLPATGMNEQFENVFGNLGYMDGPEGEVGPDASTPKQQ